jgi:hypothetical protein
VRIRDVERPAGQAVTFGPHYIHDVRNTGAAAAVSVHAYAPPLVRMNFYDVASGDLVPAGSLATDDPEPDLRAAS